ncbi:hypothetical protein C9374_003270 [Naegleria lovaniensis]|uniref:Uncharacterized protein n=1 Tax=Naegleria lovaniensis TaxID=51637 RepID=A0AA88GRC6_NAELO|nr:uncharacterized protein C9374_003270 [Naegleria lovaniensis]KAG2385455.1 hypothetical protein C9374_003270 [Naegleria lovaniensis]
MPPKRGKNNLAKKQRLPGKRNSNNNVDTPLHVNNSSKSPSTIEFLDDGKRTLFINPYHRKDDDNSDTCSVHDDSLLIMMDSIQHPTFSSSVPSPNTVDGNNTGDKSSSLLNAATPTTHDDSSLCIESASSSLKRTLSRRSSRKEINYNEQNSDDEDGEAELNKPRRRKKKKQDEDPEARVYDDEDELSAATCIRVNQLPRVFQKIMNALKPNVAYETYAVQTLLLNCALDTENFHDEESLVDFVTHVISTNPQFAIKGMKSWQDPPISGSNMP